MHCVQILPSSPILSLDCMLYAVFRDTCLYVVFTDICILPYSPILRASTCTNKCAHAYVCMCVCVYLRLPCSPILSLYLHKHMRIRIRVYVCMCVSPSTLFAYSEPQLLPYAVFRDTCLYMVFRDTYMPIHGFYRYMHTTLFAYSEPRLLPVSPLLPRARLPRPV